VTNTGAVVRLKTIGAGGADSALLPEGEPFEAGFVTPFAQHLLQM
jgi:hypothetical protein